MDPSKEIINPRREARPLPFDELTEEQRSAGGKATRLLRGMAREAWNRASRQSPVHSYLPVIYKEEHSNRVILLDGARGSGKSALLITLLDAYGRALSEQRIPPKYETWISPADRIVPVGLLDLQPLPASTHLLFHLVASLERVVEAMETRHEPPRPGTAAWHPGGEDESKSRRTWKRFARVAASGWDDNLEARKGKLDPEAFAVEVEQGELQRLDVNRSFREFMDALVDDYQAWNHWPPEAPPLFVLAIDDADMNEELSVQLLELVRKLWHPRLAFLLTGDSDLFVRRITAPRGIQNRISVDQLALDRYAKVIPLQHRFRLEELEFNQRLVKGPELGEILKRIWVPVQKNTPEQPSRSLRDYFEKDSQIMESLPGRLRLLEELADHLRPLMSESESKKEDIHSSAEAVAKTWQFAVRMNSIPTSMYSSVRVDMAGRLRIEDAFFVTWEAELKARISTAHSHLNFAVPTRVKVVGVSADDEDKTLEDQATAILLLANSVIADTEGSVEKTPLSLMKLGSPQLAYATLKESVPNGTRVHPWPLPDWNSFLDIEALRKSWERVLTSAMQSPPLLASQIAQEFLRIILSVGLGEQVGAEKPQQEGKSPWEYIVNKLVQAVTQGESNRSERQRALARWALGRAGLLAAPESGLPADDANALLDALRTSFKDAWQRARQSLLSARRKNIRISLQAKEAKRITADEIEKIIRNIDQQFQAHHFRHWIESEEVDTSEQQRAYSNLGDTLRRFHLSFLVGVIGQSTSFNSLGSYLTKLRNGWLKNAPIHMLQHAHNELYSLTQISDAGTHALMRFWKAACEATGSLDVATALHSNHDRLTINEPYKTTLDQKTTQKTSGKIHLKFKPRNQLSLSVHHMVDALNPLFTHQALEVVLRMAYDHEQDRSNFPLKAVLPQAWKGIKVQFQESPPFHPWPVPSWPTLFEWETLEQRWSDALNLAAQTVLEGDASPDLRIVDALAYCLLSACNELKPRNEPSTYLQLEPSARDWNSVLRGGWATRDAQDRDVRAWLYTEWTSRLIFMAAPESGLSDKAAINILASILPSEKPVAETVKTVSNALLLRKPHMIEAGISEEQVDSFLTEIDQANPNHPWVQRFGIWKASGDTSPR